MIRQNWRYILKIGVRIILGMVVIEVLGMVTILVLSTVVSSIDNDSGRMRKSVMLGSWVIYEEYPDTAFGSYPMRNGQTSLTGHEQWLPAFKMPIWGHTSPNMKGGRVWFQVQELGRWFPRVDRRTAAKVKEEYLRELASHGEVGQDRFNAFLGRVLTDTGKKCTQVIPGQDKDTKCTQKE